MKYFKKTAIWILCLLFSTLVFPFGSSALSADSDTVYRGIDVSVYQGKMDFSQVKSSGIDLVYIRAGYGNNVTDAYFDTNYKNAESAGLKYGFYYFVTAQTVEQAVFQATRFADLISGKSFSARPVMDFEQFGNLSNAEINEVGLAFMKELKVLTGINPMIYTDAYNASHLWDNDFAVYPLWIADYENYEPLPDNEIWESYAGYQYADNGNIGGISGYVDLDKFAEGALISAESEKVPISSPKKITYTVKSGDTLWAISRMYGVTVSAIVDSNNIDNPNLIYVGEILVIPHISDTEKYGGYIDYTVKYGDTLFGIAEKFDTTVNEIVKLNSIENPNLIYSGEVFRIPTKTTESSTQSFIYTVRRGDTLWAIARQFGTTIKEIVRLNDISNPDLIYYGEKLIIS